MKRKLLVALLTLTMLLPTVAVSAGAVLEPAVLEAEPKTEQVLLEAAPTREEEQTQTAQTSVVVEALDGAELPVFTTQETREVTQGTPVVDDGSILAPMMGWSSWNFFQGYIDEEKIMAVANALVKSGLANYGYKYVNLDDNWHSTIRDPETGSIMWDLGNFPSGASLVTKLHDMGLKVGLYSCSGDLTCEDVTGSYQHEEQDARTFAAWNIDYLKYDYCHTGDKALDAPNVGYIGITKLNADRTAAEKHEVRYEAEVAAQTGNLSIGTHKDKETDIEEKYVTGLSKNGGTLTFTVTVDDAGEYLMTIGCPKMTNYKTYLEAKVNGKDRYEVYFDAMASDKSIYRKQLYVNLNAGDNTIVLSDPVATEKDDAIRRFGNMRSALNEATEGTDHTIYFNVCEWGITDPATWVPSIGGNSWRTCGDIVADWSDVLRCYDSSVAEWNYQEPGAYNDPDMLQVGNGSLTEEENKSHFALWCMLSAPLQLGNDVRDFVDENGQVTTDRSVKKILDIVTNKDLIAINQDLPRWQCKRISTENNVDILVKPLLNQGTSEPEVAILFLNRGDDETSASVDLTKLEDDRVDTLLPTSDVYAAKELYTGDMKNVVGTLDSGSIPSHGVKVFRVSATDNSAIDKYVALEVQSAEIYPAGGTGTVTAVLKNIGKTDVNYATVKLSSTTNEGKTITATSSSAPVNIDSGKQATVTFSITLPAMVTTNKDAYADSYTLTAKAAFNYAGETTESTKTATKTVRVSEPVLTSESAGEVILSDAHWLKSTSGWSEQNTKRNLSIENGTLTLKGAEQTYEKGIGAHATSDTEIYVGGIGCNFSATVGIDAESIYGGSVKFIVLADGKVIAQTGIVTSHKSLSCYVPAGTQILTLRADCGDDGDHFDHADWADAKLTVAEAPTYNITISEPEHGKISSNPTDTVSAGQDVTFTFTPDADYKLQTATVNDNDVTSKVRNNAYVLENVQGNVTAGATFVQIPAGKDNLDRAIEEAEKLKEEDYTAESWKSFEEALDEAKTVYDNKDADQTAVDAAEKALTDAQKALVSVTPQPPVVDKTKLETAIKAAEQLKEEDYTAESWKGFKDALDAAKKVYADENATQEEVDAAEKALTDAREKLVSATPQPPVVDKEKLEEAIAKAEKLADDKSYTTASRKNLKAALDEAQDVYDDDAATQEEVNVALGKLKYAISKLKEKPTSGSSGVLLPLLPALGSDTQVTFPFNDVSKADWYYNSVRSAWHNGLINGVTEYEFQPDSTLTVAQAIKLAAALYQMEHEGKIRLTNGETKWYDTYVSYAIANGVIEQSYASYTDAQMNAPVTRGEFVHIFHGAKDGYTAISTVADGAIPDVKTTDKYAAEIYELYRAGILTGSDAKGAFHAASTIKRSEAAAILLRMFDSSARMPITLK